MARGDWYRHKTWSASIEKEFFAKLERSRAQRDQYLVIQALTIADSFPNVALRLVEQYFATKKSDFDDVRALSARAHAHVAQNSLIDAVTAMKDVLAIERRRPGHKTTTYVDYPYFVATERIESEYASAFTTLSERAGDLMFPLDIFKWNAAASIIHAELGDSESAKKHAGLALDAARVEKSGFRFHQKLGLVGDAYKDTVAELRRIYA